MAEAAATAAEAASADDAEPSPDAAQDPWIRAAPALPESDLSPWSATPSAGHGLSEVPEVALPEHEAPGPAATAASRADADAAPEKSLAPQPDSGDGATAGQDPAAPAEPDASPFDAPAPEAAAGAWTVDGPELTAPEPGRGAGFFGKLPLRGDFISRNLHRAVLRPFETWLEEVMAGCRNALGAEWQAGFDAAPLWHFWIGSAVFGTACTGAMIPSADRAGRRFPAVVLLTDEPGLPAGDPTAPRCPPPPPIAPCTAWHTACSAFLRAAPAHGDIAPFESALAALPLPAAADAGLAALARDPRRALWAQSGPGELAGLLADAAAGDHQLAAAGRSYWWTGLPGDTPGGDNAPPPAALIALEGLPDAQVFAFMLSGAGTARLANTPGSA